jgi:hypothetical protein
MLNTSRVGSAKLEVGIDIGCCACIQGAAGRMKVLVLWQVTSSLAAHVATAAQLLLLPPVPLLGCDCRPADNQVFVGAYKGPLLWRQHPEVPLCGCAAAGAGVTHLHALLGGGQGLHSGCVQASSLEGSIGGGEDGQLLALVVLKVLAGVGVQDEALEQVQAWRVGVAGGAVQSSLGRVEALRLLGAGGTCSKAVSFEVRCGSWRGWQGTRRTLQPCSYASQTSMGCLDTTCAASDC